MNSQSFIHKTADVSSTAMIGNNTKIWNQSQIREDAIIGENCIIGKSVYIDHDVLIGNNVKIQNNSSIFFEAVVEDGVFIGPHVCLSNDKYPTAFNMNWTLKSSEEWKVGRIVIKKGASIGANSVILHDVTIGEFSMIGAGSVVTDDVPNNAMYFGNPAKFHGYVCNCGNKLDEKMYCSLCRN